MAMVMDDGSFVEEDAGVESTDPLGFRVDGKKYRDRLRATRKTIAASDAYCSGSARLGGHEGGIGFFVFGFMGGSMGSAVGEKITRQLERALERERPAPIFSPPSGARRAGRAPSTLPRGRP